MVINITKMIGDIRIILEKKGVFGLFVDVARLDSFKEWREVENGYGIHLGSDINIGYLIRKEKSYGIKVFFRSDRCAFKSDDTAMAWSSGSETSSWRMARHGVFECRTSGQGTRRREIMTEHNLFYYPYASFTNSQLPLLKVAALYFDKLIILDPVGASWDTVGADHVARDAILLLKDAGILEIVTPATVLAKYEEPLTVAIRQDMGDREFLDLCETQSQSSGKRHWTLSLAKVPQNVQTDQTMRHLMGDFAREVTRDSGRFRERSGGDPHEYYEYAEAGQAYDEYREGYSSDIAYRYADFPLALGEAIMMNHALFAGLLYAKATPITDKLFHSQALALKLRRATQEPVIQQALNERARTRQLKADQLAVTSLTDVQLNLPVLDPKLPLEEVLEYRHKHDAALKQARNKLGWMARRIQAEPWSEEFAEEIEHKTIPDLAADLEEARKARDKWLKSKRGKLALKATGVVLGTAGAVLAVMAAPLTPVALATAGLGLATGTAIPGAEWLLDWRDGKKTAQENGLHYLLRI